MQYQSLYHILRSLSSTFPFSGPDEAVSIRKPEDAGLIAAVMAAYDRAYHRHRIGVEQYFAGFHDLIIFSIIMSIPKVNSASSSMPLKSTRCIMKVIQDFYLSGILCMEMFYGFIEE